MAASNPFGPFGSDVGAIRVTCLSCSHGWLYTGQTPYAQCPSCGKSNNLGSDEADFQVLRFE